VYICINYGVEMYIVYICINSGVEMHGVHINKLWCGDTLCTYAHVVFASQQ